MKLPKLPARGGASRRQMVSFGGLNLTEYAEAGELLDSKNLGSALLPALSQRGGRQVLQTYVEPTAIFAREKLCVVDGTNFIFDGAVVGQVSPGEKEFAVVNTRLCIFPDKLYFDLKNKEFGSLGASITGISGTVTFTTSALTLRPNAKMQAISSRFGRQWSEARQIRSYTYASVSWESGAWVKADGRDESGGGTVGRYIIASQNEYGAYFTSMHFSDSPVPTENQTGVYGIITASYIVQIESAGSEAYVMEATLYDGSKNNERLCAKFAVGDGVEISGCAVLTGNNKSAVVRGVSDTTLTFDANIFAAGTESAAVTVARKIPDLTYICESENRLWGVSGTTIYGSAQGQPRNFHVIDGLSTDSYAVEVGTEGAFTGCIHHSSGILFFKEHCVHKLIGSAPKNYALYTYYIPGVQAGSHRSMQMMNEALLYKGVDAVYAYDGGTPRVLSQALGSLKLSGATGGVDGQLYYLCAQDEHGVWSLLTYDVRTGIWLREDDTHARGFACVDGVLHFLSGTAVIQADTGAFCDEWLALLAPLTEDTLGRKGYTRLFLRVELAENAWFRVEISADGAPWRQVFVGAGGEKRTLAAQIPQTRCDELRIRLSGKGKCVVRALERVFHIRKER